MTLLRLALREIRNHPGFSAFFTLNLALGFMGFVALDAFESSIARALEGRSRAFLGADLDVTSRRALDAQELRDLDERVGPQASVANATVLFSMAASPERARLAELYAIDDAFPLYGDVVLEGLGPVGEAERAALRDRRGVWVDPALLAQLGLGPGDELRIGESAFRVQGVIAADGGRAGGGFSIAPRVYLSLERLADTGLVATGSRVQYRRLYRLSDDASPEALARALRATNPDPRIEVRTHVEATRELARVYTTVNDYLGLVALIAVFLAGLGSAYLFREHLARRVGEIAILVSLGATRARAQRVFLLELLLLSCAAAALACAFGALLLPWIATRARAVLPVPVVPTLGLRSVASVALLATLGSVAACLPLLARIRSLRPAELFAERVGPALGRGARDALLLLPALLAFWALAVWRVGSLRSGSVFAVAFALSVLLLLALGMGLLRALRALPARALVPRLALRELLRNRASTISSFVAIALCALLIGIAPQLRGILDRDLARPDAGALPSLFLFDIQPEQVEPLSRHVAGRGATLQRVSPMVRARLDAINGEPVASAEDGEAPPAASRATRSGADEERRLRIRRYNLTYRDRLTESEVLREGREFSGPYAPDPDDPEAPAELSLELDFARRLGVGLGDTLRFDVQGVGIAGRVVNLREVRWNSFQPNFFVLFQSGVLEEAPQVFLASVPQLPADAREALQASITAGFPNVSSIDVTRTVERVLGLMDQLQGALSSTAALSIFVGLLLVYAVARDQARARRWETNLLKVLGADFGFIRSAIDLEFGLLGLLGALAGCGISVLMSALLAKVVLDVGFAVSWTPLLAALVAIPLLCATTGRIATRSVLRERPLALLSSTAAS